MGNTIISYISEYVYKSSYQPYCTRIKISFLICLNEHLVIQPKYILTTFYNVNISLMKINLYGSVMIMSEAFFYGQASRPYNETISHLLKTS